MKSTGIVRKLDNLGRVVLPKELRDMLDIQPGDPVEIYMEGGYIILRKFAPGCVFCGEAGDVATTFSGKAICHKCAAEITQMRGR
jgi:transcriptional pleiotropic regulator of transition state genes